MKQLPLSATAKNPPEQFTGDVYEHLAMLENGEDPATTTTWLEHVIDNDYTTAHTGIKEA